MKEPHEATMRRPVHLSIVTMTMVVQVVIQCVVHGCNAVDNTGMYCDGMEHDEVTINTATRRGNSTRFRQKSLDELQASTCDALCMLHVAGACLCCSVLLLSA